ncbi:FAD-dependent monooxygenase [Bacillus sp. ISL-47]|uniref:FAD-dependent oxidoreductase n=1 Tax=Bacillus sp. ISL-47 TaxID=2819130 RepID=UPI001BE74465|nr:FAD-dependent monooxygenase [Bacillus sp. ISL-47]MBT2690645.1 FAD-dependent monooxygenase [Bacillus sp. ISL-47]MBT2709812.1 FAD-dependent monooxygenase [Pseudomonas sp. ISL-84]
MSESKTQYIEKKTALVIGGSIAGMLAARVLSDFFEEVIIIEKDPKNTKGQIRKGIPQGAQGHVLLKSGEEILEEFFPGLTDEMIKEGSVPADFANDLAWYHHGGWKIKYDSGLSIIQQSRPFLEGHIRKRMDRIDNIHTLYNTKVKGLLTDGSRVTGIEAETADEVIELSADLTVETSGASSLAVQWLKKLGFAAPEKTEIKVNLFYANRIYQKLSPIQREWKSLLVYPNPPAQVCGGGISPTVDNQWMVTLLGYGFSSPPADNDAFLEFAKNLEQPHVYEAIKDGEPVTDTEVYRFPALRRFHFEKLKSFPKGLIVMGDAFCRIDPVFAQGMSIAAKEAKALQEMFKAAGALEADPKVYHQKISKIVDIPWFIALTEDFRFSKTKGNKPIGLPLLQWYVKKVVLACSHDSYIYGRFMKVLHLQAHPIYLITPRVLKGIFRFSDRF